MFNTHLADSLNHVMHLQGMEFVMAVIGNLLVFYSIAVVVVLVNVGFTAFLGYVMLGLYRFMGWTWVDGTTKGFFERS